MNTIIGIYILIFTLAAFLAIRIISVHVAKHYTATITSIDDKYTTEHTDLDVSRRKAIFHTVCQIEFTDEDGRRVKTQMDIERYYRYYNVGETVQVYYTGDHELHIWQNATVPIILIAVFACGIILQACLILHSAS